MRERYGDGTEADSTDGPLVAQTRTAAPPRMSLLDDEYTQEVLVALCRGARRGRALIETCEASRPTVYRRLNRLVEAGLVGTETAVDPDGHHCTEFYLVRDRLTVTVEDGAVTVTARRSGTET